MLLYRFKRTWHDVKHVVVIDAERQPVGMLSIKDLLRLILATAPAPAVAAPER